MTQQVQTVIYRPDAALQPVWQFYSMPESIVGGGSTLEDARKQYFDALKFSLDDPDQPPEVREYVEREIEPLGIWIRTPLDSPNADRSWSQVASQIVQYPPEDRAWFYHHLTAGGDPVIVPATADVRLSSIFEQMTPFDSLIVVMGVHDGENLRIAWIVINGIAADREGNAPISLEQLGLTPVSSLRQVLEGATEIYGDLRAEVLAPA
jgi:hypothetical protein